MRSMFGLSNLSCGAVSCTNIDANSSMLVLMCHDVAHGSTQLSDGREGCPFVEDATKTNVVVRFFVGERGMQISIMLTLMSLPCFFLLIVFLLPTPQLPQSADPPMDAPPLSSPFPPSFTSFL